jgi:ectoine hydroxylase-related dioxygenase (phytanoyl-CoA dioxygenase family)
VDSLERNGYALADLVFTDTLCDEVIAAIPHVTPRRGGLRNLIGHPAVSRVLRDRRFHAMVHGFASGEIAAVKATLFDKTPETNWLVVWHQDRTIAVNERREIEGFGPWRLKGDVWHVEPQAAVLEQMIAVRIHLDDAGPDSGPLRVIPGSHLRGKLTAEEIADLVGRNAQVELSLPRGTILVMRPLLVHASSASSAGSHRRVLHLEFAPPDAIAPLEFDGALSVEGG